MRKTLTTVEAHKLADGTILSCQNSSGYYIGILTWYDNCGPVFRTTALKDGLPDSWEIGDWSKYAVASRDEFMIWKLEN